MVASKEIKFHLILPSIVDKMYQFYNMNKIIYFKIKNLPKMQSKTKKHYTAVISPTHGPLCSIIKIAFVLYKTHNWSALQCFGVTTI